MVASPLFQIFHLGKRAESHHMNRHQYHLGNRASLVNRAHMKRPLGKDNGKATIQECFLVQQDSTCGTQKSTIPWRGVLKQQPETRRQRETPAIDLFSLYVLFSYLRPRDATLVNSFFQLSSYARANVRITRERKNKRKIPMRASRDLKWQNNMYKLKRSINLPPLLWNSHWPCYRIPQMYCTIEYTRIN